MLHILYNKLQRRKWGIVVKNHVTKNAFIINKNYVNLQKLMSNKQTIKKAKRRVIHNNHKKQ